MLPCIMSVCDGAWKKEAMAPHKGRREAQRTSSARGHMLCHSWMLSAPRRGTTTGCMGSLFMNGSPLNARPLSNFSWTKPLSIMNAICFL